MVSKSDWPSEYKKRLCSADAVASKLRDGE
ncbi:MAG: hypothetical protein CFH38_00710, partial [Alphaproteobacteria bacterium MarineAlpha10_Bin1]